MNPETESVNEIELSNYLTKRQRKKVKNRPDMILQFAHYLAAEAILDGQKNVSVYAKSLSGLNGRPKVDLIDTEVDLSKVKYPFYEKADWILPLKIPLKN